MKREIKFRSWDGEQMLYDFIVARPQAANVLSIMTDESFALNQYGLAEWKVMQFTGLKDQNGVDIYEGDIVNQFQLIVKRPVVYINGAFGYFDTDTKYKQFISFAQNQGYNWDNGQSNDVEIIGNIYQNPGLI